MRKYNGISSRNHQDFKVYQCWVDMNSRCYRVKDKQYHNYGARGIRVCDEWVSDFMLFYDWAKINGWKDGLQIDRIDVNNNYEPSNCQFVTNAENNAIGKRRLRTDSTSGYTGVYFLKQRNRFSASIFINNKLQHIGCYLTIEEALRARINKEIELFGKQLTNILT